MGRRITEFPRDLPLLNRALERLEALEAQVSILNQQQAARNSFDRTVESTGAFFSKPQFAFLGAPVGSRWLVDLSADGSLGFYSDNDDTFAVDSDFRLYRGATFRKKVKFHIDGEVEADSFTP